MNEFKMIASLFLFLLLFIIEINGDLLDLRSGLINGTVGKTKNGRSFQQFYGIPYAEPPVGSLRFKDPVPAKSWSSVKDASKPPPMCIQHKGFFNFSSPIIGQEDCLYLNVFVPNDLFNTSSKTPVIVGIHGGGFIHGEGIDYNPDYFMDHDVVFVTFNYRLGSFGFLGLNNNQISGNFGLKDQTLALQWVKENIAKFGGDPNSVTLLGESAGAMSIHLHMFSPLSKGLFQRAIMQSGCAFSHLTQHEEGYGEAIATTFLLIAGCFRKDSAKVLSCLQRIPAEDIIKMGDSLVPQIKNSPINTPIIESNVNNRPFLPQKPSKTTYQTLVPWIIGINSCDGCIFAFYSFSKAGPLSEVKNTRKQLLSSLNERLPQHVLDNVDNATQKVTDFYFNANDTGSDLTLSFVNMVTDYNFLHPLVQSVKSSHDRQYVYLYDFKGSFSWRPPTNLTKNLGSDHAEELPLLFRNEKLEAKWTPEDKKISESLVRFWTNFAIFTNPNGPSGEKIWTPVETEDIEFLRIRSDSFIMEKKTLKERSDFWESLK
ncbi:juvenile hormone esterase-like [Planococcus citri]|uniref:juvenile hormone esterase-like n=1 Tax=Planococcus citri TaxID=170843 RepID=UPI0031F94298